MGTKSAAKAAPAVPSADDTAALLSDVKAFASQLGFASAGVASGFDDRDFLPHKAKQPISRAAEQKKAAKPEREAPKPASKDKTAAQKPSRGKPEKAAPVAASEEPAAKSRGGPQPSRRQPPQQQQQAAAGRAAAAPERKDPIRDRSWTESVGERPGKRCAVWLPACAPLRVRRQRSPAPPPAPLPRALRANCALQPRYIPTQKSVSCSNLPPRRFFAVHRRHVRPQSAPRQ